MQTTYNTTQQNAFAGMKADIGFDYVESMIAEEQINFGSAMVKNVGESKRIRLPNANVSTITDDGGTYTAGNMPVTINGYSFTVTYDTDKATMMAAIATAIQALAFVLTAAYSGTALTITAQPNVNQYDVTLDVSGITGTMTISSVIETCTEAFRGVAVASQHMEQIAGQIVYDKATITFEHDALNTSDTVTVTLNGITLSAITYATSEAVTLGLIAHLSLAEPGILSASVSGRVPAAGRMWPSAIRPSPRSTIPPRSR